MLPLEIDHLTKRYGGEVVVDDLSFTVARVASPASSDPTAPASPRR